MLSYRLLAVTISLASFVLADVLVQPGYEHQFDSGSHSQSAPQYRTNSLTEHYRTEQIPNQESTYLPEAQSARTVHPYHISKPYSKVVSYPYRSPYFHHSHYYSRPYHPHFAKIGSYGYMRPSVFVGYPQQPSILGYPYQSYNHHHHRYRYRRSLESDSTKTESNKPAIVAHENDVAAKSSLTDAKLPKAIDSLLPEHESTDTNDKHVENRQIQNYDPMKPGLFGLYPQNIDAPDHSRNTMKHVLKFTPLPGTESNIDEQSPAIFPLNKQPDLLKPKFQLMQQTARQNKQPCTTDDVHFLKPSIRFDASSEELSNDDDGVGIDPRTNRPSMRQSSEEPSFASRIYDNYNTKYQQIDIPSFTSLQYLMGNYYWPEYYNRYFPNFRRPTSWELLLRPAHQELEKKSLQEITNMDMVNMAEPRQEKMQLYIPHYSQKLSEITNAPMTAAAQPRQSLTDDIYGNMGLWDYSADEMSTSPLAPIVFYPDDLDDEEISRNANSVHHIKSTNIPDYIFNKNISARSNLAPIMPEMQSRTDTLETYNNSPESNMQVIPSDHRYSDQQINSYPSDTPLYDTFSSPVYY